MPEGTTAVAVPGSNRLDGLSPTDAMIRRLVEAHRTKLQNLRTNPKGMTHGDVQADLAACERILG